MLTLLKILTQQNVLVLLFNYFLSFGGFLALTSYLPIFENSYYNVDSKNAGIFTAVFSISTSLGFFCIKINIFKIINYCIAFS